MSGFNRRAKSDSRPKSFSNKNFGGGGFHDGHSKFDKRDSGRGASLFQAVCHTCGKECEVPFRPNGKKPVFCSICFDKQGGASAERFGKKSFDRPRFEERRRPDFERKNDGGENKNIEQLKHQLFELNTKVDKILNALEEMGKSKTTDVEFDEPIEKPPFKMKKKVSTAKKTTKKK